MSEKVEGATNVQAQQGSSVFVAVPEATPSVDIVPRLDGLGGFVVLKDGYSLTKIEAKQEGKPEHVFDDVTSFAEYLNRHHIETDSEVTVDVLVQNDRVIAFIDPEQCDPQVVACVFVEHPAWEAWSNVFDEVLTQRQIQQFVRAWRSTIEGSEQLMAVFSAIQVTGATSMTSHMDETGAVRLASAEGSTDMAVKVPSTIVATVPCYDGVMRDGVEATYQLEILVTVQTEPLTFSLECPTLALAKRAARRDLAGQLRELLDPGFLVGLGMGEHGTRAVENDEPAT
jgi:hypothetical protein